MKAKQITLNASYIKSLSVENKINFLSNDICPDEIIELLSNDRSHRVRAAITAHTKCPIELLIKYSNDAHPGVLCGVASNSKTPYDILVKLSDSETDIVVVGVGENPLIDSKLKNKMLERLAFEFGCYYGAVESLIASPEIKSSLINKLSKHSNWNVRRAVARKPYLSNDVVNRLAGDVDSDVQEAILENESLEITSKMLNILVKTGSWQIRQSIASRMDCPLDVLIYIAETDDDTDVLNSMLKNSKCPLEVPVIIVNRADGGESLGTASAAARRKLTQAIKSGGPLVKEQIEGMKTMLELGFKLSAGDSVVLNEINI
jgi:hypothetical protein